MAQQKRAVVVGALGVIGRYIVERLLAEDGWSVVGLSRRDAASGPGYRHLSRRLDSRAASVGQFGRPMQHAGRPFRPLQHADRLQALDAGPGRGR